MRGDWRLGPSRGERKNKKKHGKIREYLRRGAAIKRYIWYTRKNTEKLPINYRVHLEKSENPGIGRGGEIPTISGISEMMDKMRKLCLFDIPIIPEILLGDGDIGGWSPLG